jgi:tRNA A37 N6-isopentenylltransferase MiaA
VRLEELSTDELQRLAAARNLPLPENARNPRHLIRLLETGGELPRRDELRPHTLLLGLDPGREILRRKIIQRVDTMMEQGFLTEVRELSEQYGWDVPALLAPGYRAFRLYLEGAISLEEAKQQFVQNDMQYAKRQQTWFKRNGDIHWISKTAEAVDLITTLLNN